MKCRGCGAPHPPDELSEHMECGRCFVARMATTVQIPRQTLAECAADWRKQLSEQGLVRKESNR